MRRRARLLPLAALVAAVAAVLTPGAPAAPRARAAATLLRDWPEFGLDPQRTNATDDATGITAANVRRLRRRQVALPGTADSSAIYVHRALIGGARHDAAIVTTSYGITLAIDAGSGRTLWRFDPPGLSSWQGSGQVTTATPLAYGGYVYAASPDGRIHKLALASGREAAGWPVSITPKPEREKLDSALNVAGGDLLATTAGYYGDAPPYVGHIVAIALTSGRIEHVFNALCAARRRIIDPSSCHDSDAGIWSRGAPVVEPGAARILITTGNGPYNARTSFGDSLIELNFPALTFRQAYTPPDQAHLDSSDNDFGSGTPALLPGHLVLMAGKDNTEHLLNVDALDGHPPGSAPQTGGDLQTLPTPASQAPYTADAVWHGMVFTADDGATLAYRIAGGRLSVAWQNGTSGTSPIVAGGLLYVYDDRAGGVNVYDPRSGHQLARLRTPDGHWNSPIVVDGLVIETSGNYMDHSTHGRLDIFSTR